MEILRRVCTGSFVFLAVVPFTGCFQRMVNIDPVSTRHQTRSAIDITEERIHLFWNENGRLPSSTKELPNQPDKNNKTTDGWGRELGWAQIDEKTIRLSSLGKDGKVGGTGDNEDQQVDVVVDQKD